MKIGILTGGGDVPGLNACIKAVVNRVADGGHEVVGIRRGWAGLLYVDPADMKAAEEHFLPLDRRVVRTIDRSGGTMLHSSRTNPGVVKEDEVPEFLAEEAVGDPPYDFTSHALEVVEALEKIRFIVEPNEHGIECDLLWEGAIRAVEEPRMFIRRHGRVLFDTSRFAQTGTWSGVLRVGEETHHVTPDCWWGARDRSWGVRPVGEPEAGAPGSPPRIFFLWAPLHFDDICTHFGVFEEQDGTRWHEDGMIVPTYASPDAIPDVEDPGIEHMVSLGHRLQYERGTRRAKAAEIELNTRSGEQHVITLEPLLRFQMLGLGYVHPEWGHGVWKGEEALAGESWKLEALDPLLPQHQHIQQVMRARMGEREGVGVLEQLCFGPHKTYGFKELLDGAA